jgi:hypothetical protein
MISQRVARLRQESLAAKPHISTERAELVTEAYGSLSLSLSAPMRRALVFRHLLEKKAIHLGEDELIVGEKGRSCAATASRTWTSWPHARRSPLA